MKYRSRTEIVRSILEAASASEGTNRTKLMYKSYLAYGQLKEHLKTLQENVLIEYEARGRCYRITKKGIELLRLLNKMEKITPINYVDVKSS
jgi:predicted transcriptional regulator